MSDSQVSTADKAKGALLWVITILAALAMGVAGVTKFTTPDMWNAMFTEWGYSIGFKSLIGAVEIVGAVSVLVPRFATYAATVLVLVMVGAVYTLVSTQSEMSIVPPLGNLILFAIIAVARRNVRWTPGG